MKISIFFSFLFCYTTSLSLFSQSNIQQATSINTDGAAPAASAMLDVQATDKGMLVPRMTLTQRQSIASPATGLLVFDITTNGFWFYNGVMWRSLSSSNTPFLSYIADADSNTIVQTEELPNEDIIRFDLGGTEKMVLQKNASGAARLELPDAAGTTIIGQEAGVNNIPISDASGENNTFLGYRSGNGNTAGSGNTASGASSFYSNSSGSLNTANGIYALFGNTTGNENTATGSFALTSNSTGQYNTANGSNALLNNTTASYNTATGNSALFNNTIGYANTASGAGALYSNTVGQYNTANGANALNLNTTGNYNTANGVYALYNNNGNDNTANGVYALYSNTTGQKNTATGTGSLYANTTGFGNTATGENALYANTTGTNNTASGDVALYSNTTGYSNAAHGVSALYKNSTGYENTATGTTALHENTTGIRNTATGYEALYYNTTGDGNTAEGYAALRNNTTGYGNTAIGDATLISNGTGIYNSALGTGAAIFTSSGSNNTAIGYYALINNQTGSWNTAIGELTKASSVDANGRTMLGSRAYSECDNCVVIGSIEGKNGSTVTAKIGIGTSNPTHLLELGFDDAGKPGTNTWVITSDKRLKENIQTYTDGLASVLKIKPVTFHYTDNSGFDPQPEYVGILAQELQEIAPYMVSENERQLKDGTDGKYLTVDNGAMTYMLINAVKELEAENEDLKSQLQKIMAALQSAGISVEK